MQQIETPYDATSLQPLSAEHCRELDFDSVELRQIEKGYWMVRVRGVKPHPHMKVELVPTVHLHQPDYWDIKVRGCVNADINNPKSTPFEVTLPLAACKGVKGLEIVGATKTTCYDVPKA